MIGGSYNPIHNGHVNSMKYALTLCEELHIVIGDVPNLDIASASTKVVWLQEILKEYKDRIYYHILKDHRTSKSEYTISRWLEDSRTIKESIGKHIDIVFCGADYDYEGNPYSICYPEQEIIYLKRSDGINSTEFRENPELHKDWVPDIVYQYCKRYATDLT